MSTNTVSQHKLMSSRSVAYGNKDLVDSIMRGYMLGEKVVIPNVFDLCSHMDLRKYYLDLFEAEVDDPKGVSEPLRLIQGMAFDGEFIGYNKKTGEAKLYSAQAKRIEQLTGRSFNVGKTLEKNQRGVINCMRLDISYETEKQFTIKAVNLNVKTELVQEDTIFIPFWVIPSMIRILHTLLRENPAVKIEQGYGQSIKSRFVSGKAKVIKKYTDSFLQTIPRPLSFPLYFQIYLPVLGAPSSTVGLTRVDLLSLDRIEVVPGSNWASLPVAPVNPNPLSSLLEEQVSNIYIDSLFIPEIEAETAYFKDRVLAVMNDFGLDVSEESGRFELIKKTHELSAEQNMIFWKEAVPSQFHEYLVRMSQILNNYELVQFDSPEELQYALQSGAYLINSLTKKGKFSNAILTRSPEILHNSYGANYVARYESKRVKDEYARELLLSGQTDLQKVKELSGIELHSQEDAQEFLASPPGSSLKGTQSYPSDQIFGRALFQLAGSPMYFRQIPFNRIERVLKLTK